ncbi:MAG: glycine oxidase ThiO [Alphaproteobacteria bacterium]|nr:glycine oxidase ThiO [Alphaproteobacteria bacterium]
MKVLIAGGGIAGLAIAWRLSCHGITVEVVERGICGRGASWAAAGMLAPGGELAGETDEMAKLAHESRALWPQFAAEIERAGGCAVGFRETGSLLIAETQQQAKALRARANGSGEWLSRDELLRLEPLLSPNLLGAICFHADAQVDNRAMCEALYAALRAKGVTIRENCEVRSILTMAGEATALLTDRGQMEADNFVLACGAWMDLISAPDFDLPPVRPVKGQMMAYAPPAGIGLPDALLWAGEVYLVPRAGRLLVGATVEDAGFDSSVELQACAKLRQAAARVIPSLPKWQLAEVWAGLRPHTPDDAPVLGATSLSRLYVAGGQFRNGILFAPAVADKMAAILEGRTTELAAAFNPLRFT